MDEDTEVLKVRKLLFEKAKNILTKEELNENDLLKLWVINRLLCASSYDTSEEKW